MRILVIDDEMVALTKMKAMLSDYGQVDTADNARTALQLFHKAYLDGYHYKLITIDIDMPGMNGIDMMKIINDDEDNLFIPKAIKIIITASGSTNHVYQAIENHCDAFLVKPVKKNTLKEKLQKVGFIG